MKRVTHFLIASFLCLFLGLTQAQPVHADEPSCTGSYSNYDITTSLPGGRWPTEVDDGTDYVELSGGSITVTISGLYPQEDYTFSCRTKTPDGSLPIIGPFSKELYKKSERSNDSGTLILQIDRNDCFRNDTWQSRDSQDRYVTPAHIRLEGGRITCDDQKYYNILYESSGATCGTVSVQQTSRQTENNTCYQPGDTGTWSFSVNNGANKDFIVAMGNYTRDQFLGVDVDDGRNYFLMWNTTTRTNGQGQSVDLEGNTSQNFTLNNSAGADNIGQPFNFYVFDPGSGNVICSSSLGTVRALCGASPEPLPSGGGSNEPITTFSVCRQIPVMSQQQINAQVERITDPEEADRIRQQLERKVVQQRQEKVRCCSCIYGTTNWNPETGACSGEDGTDVIRQRSNFKPGLYTAVGCIGLDQESIITRLVRIGLGIAGGIALLMILAGAFMLSTSAGEPKKAGEAKELITSAVMGLLFVIFSVTILQFIGVTILRIPGFGGPTATGM